MSYCHNRGTNKHRNLSPTVGPYTTNQAICDVQTPVHSTIIHYQTELSLYPNTSSLQKTIALPTRGERRERE